MSKDKIPQYHPSYTEEENRAVYEYLENSTKKDLVHSVYQICHLYQPDEQEKILTALRQFCRKLAKQKEMQERYKKLLKCVEDWEKYADALQNYRDAVEIKKYYARFKKNFSSKGQDISILEMFIEEYSIEDDCLVKGKSPQFVKLMRRKSKEFIRRAVINKKQEKEEEKETYEDEKKPKKPKYTYLSFAEIPVEPISEENSLQLLGSKNLKYLCWLLLSSIDDIDNNNVVTVILSFLEQKYFTAINSHKTNLALFSSKTKNSYEIEKDCQELFRQMKGLQGEVQKLERQLEYLK